MTSRLSKELRALDKVRDVRHALTAKEKTVTTAGTAEPLLVEAETRVTSLVITGKLGNTGQVYVDDYQVSSSTNDGLDAGESISMKTEEGWFDLAHIFIDVDTSGEGVDFAYVPYIEG